MGLDMYLKRRTYIGAMYDHNYIGGKIELIKGKEPIEIDLHKIESITEQVAYWRKCNAIHRWFVTNVQDGVDNCAEYYVTKEQLKQLRDKCEAILNVIKEKPEIAEQELPTAAGFFFGSTDYDDDYANELRDTITMIDPILARQNDKAEYYYKSS